jgi:beta-glucanase (GH16 family)
MSKIKNILFVCAIIALTLPQCHATDAVQKPVWAVNVGGPAYLAKDGTSYSPEQSISGGEIGTLDKVLGSQDPFIYHSYREGDIQVEREISNGQYTATFHFAEPMTVEPGQRVFDILIEGQPVFAGLDVMMTRDGKIESALTVTIPNIEITDGVLNISFETQAGSPLLSALVVRKSGSAATKWKLAWSDEFNSGDTPNPERWSIDVWPARVVNDEDQAYTDHPKNLRIEDGSLVIEAHKEKFGNADYTSARIHSLGKGDLLYGRVEVRAKIPAGKGTWAAAWMLPTDPFHYATSCETGQAWQGIDDCDAWPNSGEIDIMEHVGYQPGHIHGTVHNKAYYWKTWQQRKGRIIMADIEDDFHDYVLEWSPERIDVFLDEELYFTYINEGQGWQVWPYDQPFHIVINLAIGGAWGRSGGGIDDSKFPQKMLIDYVRVYHPRP